MKRCGPVDIRQQAKALQEEGKAILENAKREIEKMIIDESSVDYYV